MLRVTDEIFERFPGVRIGTVVATGVDNGGDRPELTAALRDAEAAARQALGDGPLVEHPRIAPWREAYRAFGAKPKKYPSSLEALARRVLKGEELPTVLPLVDLYNAVSLRHLLPVGGEDLERLVGPLVLRLAGEDEPPVSLLGRPQPQAPAPGEVIYADDAGAVCRRWNWREAARTRLRAETTDAILVVEALPPVTGDELQVALDELASRVTASCGGRCETAVFG